MRLSKYEKDASNMEIISDLSDIVVAMLGIFEPGGGEMTSETMLLIRTTFCMFWFERPPINLLNDLGIELIQLSYKTFRTFSLNEYSKFQSPI